MATTSTLLSNLAEVLRLRDRGATFYVSHSAGKDSQTMWILLSAIIPAAQLVIIYADLGRVVWDGTVEHIVHTTGRRPVRSTPVSRGVVQYTDYYTGEVVAAPAPQDAFLVCKNESKDFLSMWEARGLPASPKFRQCTSDLKRGPIQRTIRCFQNDAGLTTTIVDCAGLRAGESDARAKTCQHTLEKDEDQSVAGRTWYSYLPIATLKCVTDQDFDSRFHTDQVFGTIAAVGQQPHFAYLLGMSRLSCVFCIMASPEDLAIAARARPELLAEYLAMEAKTGHTLFFQSASKKAAARGEKGTNVSLAEKVAEGERRLATKRSIGSARLQVLA